MDPVTVIVDSRIRIPVSEIPSEAVERICELFTHTNPTRIALVRMGVPPAALRNEPAEILTWDLSKTELSIPRGGIGRMREVFAEFGIRYRVIDNRTEGKGPKGIPAHKLSLRDFQEEMVNVGTRIENALLRAPTGSGKTTAALALASTIDLPTLVIVWTGNLFDQWVRRAVDELGIPEREVGMLRGSKRTIKPLTIAMQQTLVNCVDEYADQFGVVICDEVQRFAARTFLSVIDRLPARYRFGISADERRKDRKEFLLYDVFGDIAVDISQSELIERGFVHDVAIDIIPTGFSAPWHSKLFERDDNPSMAKVRARLQAFNRLVEEMAGDSERNAIAVQTAIDYVEKGERVVVMSHRREHCITLDADISSRGYKCGRMLGTDEDEPEFEATRKGLATGEIRVATGTFQAIGTGLDMPSVSVGIVATPIANSRDGRSFFGQVRGRFCRTSNDGKTSARLVYLWDREVYGLKPVENLCRWNRTVRILEGGMMVDAKEFLKRERENAVSEI